MRILREAEETSFNTIEDCFQYYLKNINTDTRLSDSQKKSWIESKLTNIEKVSEISGIVTSLFLSIDVDIIKYLNDLSFNVNTKNKNNVLTVIKEIIDEDTDISNKDLYRFITKYSNLYDNSESDFSYIMFIAKVLSDENKLKKYFKDTSDISIDTIIDGDKVKSATEIYNLIEKLSDERGSEITSTEDGTKLDDFFKEQKITGNYSYKLNTLGKLIANHFNELSTLRNYDELYQQMFETLADNEEVPQSTRNDLLSELTKYLFKQEYPADPSNPVKFLQEFINTFDDYTSRNEATYKELIKEESY